MRTFVVEVPDEANLTVSDVIRGINYAIMLRMRFDRGIHGEMSTEQATWRDNLLDRVAVKSQAENGN